jgi:hypothetical protein
MDHLWQETNVAGFTVALEAEFWFRIMQGNNF